METLIVQTVHQIMYYVFYLLLAINPQFLFLISNTGLTPHRNRLSWGEIRHPLSQTLSTHSILRGG
jgi:hypothetical protein